MFPYQSKINFPNVELHHDDNLKKLIIGQSLLALGILDKNVREGGANKYLHCKC